MSPCFTYWDDVGNLIFSPGNRTPCLSLDLFTILVTITLGVLGRWPKSGPFHRLDVSSLPSPSPWNRRPTKNARIFPSLRHLYPGLRLLVLLSQTELLGAGWVYLVFRSRPVPPSVECTYLLKLLDPKTRTTTKPWCIQRTFITVEFDVDSVSMFSISFNISELSTQTPISNFELYVHSIRYFKLPVYLHTEPGNHWVSSITAQESLPVEGPPQSELNPILSIYI